MTKLPGQYSSSFRVSVPVATGKEVKDDSGMRVSGFNAADLLEQVTYVGDLERLDGRWTLVLQWVDLDNDGHRFLIPHEVVERILTHADNILARARSDRSLNAAATRRERQDAKTKGETL